MGRWWRERRGAYVGEWCKEVRVAGGLVGLGVGGGGGVHGKGFARRRSAAQEG